MKYPINIYPATMAQLREIAKKKCMGVNKLINLFLQMCCAHELLMEKETANQLLEDILTKCIAPRD